MERMWRKTTETLPNRELLKSEFGKGFVNNSHADCFIYINGQVIERTFNFHHECWDDQEYDDFEFEATEPTHWMLAQPLQNPPED